MANSNPGVSDTAARLVVRSAITMRSPSGMGAGSMLWICGRRMLVEVDHELHDATEIELKVDLSPVPGTALLTARVERNAPATPHEMARYVLELVEVSRDDRQRWDSWLAAKEAGGTLSNLSDVKDRGAGLESGYVQQAERERRAAVERLMRGAVGGSPRSTPSAGAATPSVASWPGAGGRFGSNTWTNSDIREVGSGRVAMRQALKSAIKRTFDDTSTPEFEGPRTPPSGTAFAQRVSIPPGQKPLVEDNRPASRHSLPPDLPPPRAVRDATLPPVHTPALQSAVPDTTRRAPAPPTAAHLDDPNWTLSEFRGNSYLDVCWNSVDAFALDAFGQMLACTLTLRTSDRPLPFQAPILMVLRHGTMVVQCEATVLEHGPDHAIYRLKLDPGQISEIRRSAETSSVISGAMDHAKRR